MKLDFEEKRFNCRYQESIVSESIDVSFGERQKLGTKLLSYPGPFKC